MYMKIYCSDFIDAFENRRPGQFSSDGLVKLYDHLEEFEDSAGEKIELDVIALCCEYVELNLDEINEAYDQAFESLEDAADWLENKTTVAGVTDSSIVFVQF